VTFFPWVSFRTPSPRFPRKLPIVIFPSASSGRSFSFETPLRRKRSPSSTSSIGGNDSGGELFFRPVVIFFFFVLESGGFALARTGFRGTCLSALLASYVGSSPGPEILSPSATPFPPFFSVQRDDEVSDEEDFLPWSRLISSYSCQVVRLFVQYLLKRFPLFSHAQRGSSLFISLSHLSETHAGLFLGQFLEGTSAGPFFLSL